MLQKNSTIDRRSFIRISSLTSGGILIGFNLFTACKEGVAPPVDVSQLNFKDFNAFIKIAENGMVTLYSPNPEIGQGVKTSMPMIIAEELEVAWKDVVVAQAPLDTKNFTRQVAGGSQSIRHGWQSLRETGAAARQMLVNAAAARWGVSPEECTAREGVVYHQDGRSLGYGELVAEAAALEIPADVRLKEPSEFKIIGKDAINVDMDKIITGKPLFGIDYKEEGMVFAAVLRPPAFGSTLESFDDSEALQVAGVKQTLRFGDKVAVIASNTWAAFKGKSKLKAVWKDPEQPESSADHVKILNGLLDGKEFKTLREDGNVDKAFAEADKVLERTYSSTFLPHNCMEPMNFFGKVNDEQVVLVGPIQTPERTRTEVSELLGRPEDQIHIDMTRMGGGFGRRLYGDFVLEVAEIADKLRMPVKLMYSREDDMAAGIYRPAIHYRIKAAVKDGKISAYRLREAAINGNMYDLIPNFFPAGAIENYKVEVASHDSPITTGAWRAPYTNFLAFAEQSFFDELFELMEADPVQTRLDMLEKVKGTADERIQYSPERMQQVIRLAAEKSNWGKAPEGTYQGFVAYYCHNTHVAEVAEVVMENDMPRVTKVYCAVDCGIVVNPTGARNQVAGGVLDGIGHAMYGQFSFLSGTPEETNFDRYRLIRMKETPQVEVWFVENELSPTGLGEPGLPPAAPAVANAVKKATGLRLYEFPFLPQLGKSRSDIVG